MAQSTEEWINEKVDDFNKDKLETLEDLLITTTDVIKQYVTSPTRATKGVLESCLNHNTLLLKELFNYEK